MNICLKMMHSMLRHECLLCLAACPGRLLCAACSESLPRLAGTVCPSCALPIPGEPGGAACGRCLQDPPVWHGILAGWTYAFPLDRLIHAFKYRHAFGLAEELVRPLVQRCPVLPRPDFLLPMPLHPLRQRERGYNQSLLLARELERALGLPLLVRACRRRRSTAVQTGLSAAERWRNLHQAFDCNAAVRGRHIAIVDDVMTSGASLHHLTRALLAAGAARVDGWVLARALPGRAS